MATALSINSRQSLFQNIFERVVQGVDSVSGNRLGNWLKSSTGLSPLPTFLSGNDFGVAKALNSPRQAPTLSEMLIETMNYAVEEARERLSLLVSGKFKPATFNDLMKYLKSHSFDLEVRFNKSTGEATNMLVDINSKRSVPAAQVDPSLSYKNVLKAQLQTQLREHVGADNPAVAYGSWAGMDYVRNNISSKYGYTVENEQGYFGRVLTTVSFNEDENIRFIADCKSRNIDLILPRDSYGDLVPGMAILARVKSMKAEDVNPNLAYKSLTQNYNSSMINYYKDLADKRQSRMSPIPTNEISMSNEDFAKMFLMPANDLAQAAVPLDRGNVADISIKMLDTGKLLAWDSSIDMEHFVPLSELPYGEYDRIDAKGSKLGVTTVGDGGQLAHYDINNNLIENPTPKSPAVANENSAPEYTERKVSFG